MSIKTKKHLLALAFLLGSILPTWADVTDGVVAVTGYESSMPADTVSETPRRMLSPGISFFVPH